MVPCPVTVGHSIPDRPRHFNVAIDTNSAPFDLLVEREGFEPSSYNLKIALHTIIVLLYTTCKVLKIANAQKSMTFC